MNNKRVWPVFVAGLLVGVLGTVFVPRYVRPHLPDGLAGEAMLVSGIVRAKQVELDRVLLTVATTQGTLLASFTGQASEVDLLVSVGDSLSLRLREYAPFLENPVIEHVAQGSAPTGTVTGDSAVIPTDDDSAMTRDSLGAVPDTSRGSND